MKQQIRLLTNTQISSSKLPPFFSFSFFFCNSFQILNFCCFTLSNFNLSPSSFLSCYNLFKHCTLKKERKIKIKKRKGTNFKTKTDMICFFLHPPSPSFHAARFCREAFSPQPQSFKLFLPLQIQSIPLAFRASSLILSHFSFYFFGLVPFA